MAKVTSAPTRSTGCATAQGEGRRAVQDDRADHPVYPLRHRLRDKDAVDNYVASMQSITKKIFANFEKTYLTCPWSSRLETARPSLPPGGPG